MNSRQKLIVVGYINRLQDEGMRKVMLLQALYGKTPKEVADLLKLRVETVEKIGKKGAKIVQAYMYNDLKIKGHLIA